MIATNASSPPSQGLYETVEKLWSQSRSCVRQLSTGQLMSLSPQAHLSLLNSSVMFSHYYNIDYDSIELIGKNAVNLMLLVKWIKLPSYRTSACSEHSHYHTFCTLRLWLLFDLYFSHSLHKWHLFYLQLFLQEQRQRASPFPLQQQAPWQTMMSLHGCVPIQQGVRCGALEGAVMECPLLPQRTKSSWPEHFPLALQKAQGSAKWFWGGCQWEARATKAEPEKPGHSHWPENFFCGGIVTFQFNCLILLYCFKTSLLLRRFYWTFLCALSAKSYKQFTGHKLCLG